MRYHYEYCEWNDLTNEVYSLFKINEELPINYKNNIEYEAFRIEENRQMNGNYIKRINSIFQYVKERLTYLKRDIRRNSSFFLREIIEFSTIIPLASLLAEISTRMFPSASPDTKTSSKCAFSFTST